MSNFLGLRRCWSSFQSVANAALQRPADFLHSTSWRTYSTLPAARPEYGRTRPLALSRAKRASRWPPPPLRAGTRTLFSRAVIKHYVDLPPNYKDDVGLPFRNKDLSHDEVVSLFGAGANPIAANKLLRILHGRRVAGTLEDPEFQRNTRMFPKAQQKTALEYLRTTVPVDEIINAGLRAEDELNALEPPEEDAETKPVPRGVGYTNRYKIYQTTDEGNAEIPDNVYGQGVFDRIRAANVAKREEELKRREEEQRKREEEQARQGPGHLQKIDENRPRELSPQMKKWTAAATSDLKEAPTMSRWARLAPSVAVALLVVGAMAIYAELYKPPEQRDRLWPGLPPAAATVAGLIGVNVLIWAAWKIPPLWAILNRSFLVVAATPRPFSLLGAMFSHQKLSHLIPNMLFVWFFGIRLHDEIGRGDFLALYVSSGVVGFLGTLTSLVLRNKLGLTTLGASGGVYGITTAYFWLHRFDGFKILGLPPDPGNGVQGLGFIGLIMALNIAALFSRRGHMMDVVSHLVGMAMGILGGQLLQERMKEKKASSERQTNLGIADKVMEKR